MSSTRLKVWRGLAGGFLIKNKQSDKADLEAHKPDGTGHCSVVTKTYEK